MNKVSNSDSGNPIALSHGEMRAMLEWYQAAGINLGVASEPVDQFALKSVEMDQKVIQQGAPNSPPQITASLEKAKPKQTPMAQLPIDQEQGDPDFAAKSAAGANSLSALRTALDNLSGCSLRVRATQLVFGEGNPEAKIMLVGKAPSREDDLQGGVFCGKAGALLDNMLSAIGLGREQVYLSNIVPWRPPGNRDPAPHEIAMCLPFLKRQIELVSPELLISFGELAAKSLFGDHASVSQLQGQWHDLRVDSHNMQGLASLHPELLLKQPVQKRVAWAHLQKVKQAMADQCQI